MWEDYYTEETQKITGRIFEIEYFDGKKQWNNYTIIASYFKYTPSGAALCAICAETKKRRQFKIGRIESVVDLDSGEVFRNGFHWFRDLGNQFIREVDTYSTRSKFLDPLLPEINIALFVASADGYLNEEKINAVKHYCYSLLEKPIESKSEVEKFERALNKIIEDRVRPEVSSHRDLLHRWYMVRNQADILMYFARCDGTQHPREEEVVAAFIRERMTIGTRRAASEEEVAECIKTALRLRPTEKDMRSAIWSLDYGLSKRQRNKLLTAIEEVIAADEHEHPEEVALRERYLERIRLGADHPDSHDIIEY